MDAHRDGTSPYPNISNAPFQGEYSFEKAYEIPSEQKDFYGFFLETKDFCQGVRDFFGVKCPSIVAL